MLLTSEMVAAIKAGAMTGVVGGMFPLIPGLWLGQRRKALIGFAACVIGGAIAGMYAVIPLSLGSLFAIIREKNERQRSHKPDNLEFGYGRILSLITLLGMPVLGVVSIVLVAVAGVLLSRGDTGFGMKLNAAFVGTLGLGFGWLSFFGLRHWYVFLSRYTLSDDGVEIALGKSRHFSPWAQLVSAKYVKAFSQIELEFSDYPRRVILGNVDFDPQKRLIHRALERIERSTGCPVDSSIL